MSAGWFGRGWVRLGALGALVAVAGCPTGWRLVRVEGELPSVHAGTWKEIHATATEIASDAHPCSVCRKYSRPLVHCAAGKSELCRERPITDGIATPSEAQLTSLWSFVHMSDVQLKEHRVRMQGAISEAAYDGLTNGALRNPDLERHDDAVLLSTVMAINALECTDWLSGAFGGHPPAPPRFVIHTGDAVDVGLFSELAQFLAAMNELRLPFYNSVGNHDTLFFGAFPFEHMKGNNVLLPFIPIYDTDRFMRFHSHEGGATDLAIPNMTDRLPHVPTQSGVAYPPADQEASAYGALIGRDGPQSNFHGFDAACYRGINGTAAGNQLCPEARGYYSFDVDLPSRGTRRRKLRFVMLNTSEVVPETVDEGFSRMAEGNVQPEQLRWLDNELRRGDQTPTIDAEAAPETVVDGGGGGATNHGGAGGEDSGAGGAGGSGCGGGYQPARHRCEIRAELDEIAAADRGDRSKPAEVYTIVAGHHQLSGFLHDDQRDRLKEILLSAPRVLAYLSGHTHQDAVTAHSRENGRVFWELTAGSTLVFPQLSRLVELLETEDGDLWLRVATFRQQLSDHADEIESGTRCRQLAQRAKLARDGAERDDDRDREKEEIAIENANGLFPVWLGSP